LEADRDISASGYEFDEIALHNSTAENNAMNYLYAPENPVPVKRTAQPFMIAAFLVVTGESFAQEPVVDVGEPESLFTDTNPKLNANKQATTAHHGGPVAVQSLGPSRQVADGPVHSTQSKCRLRP
jgi:hypothetical protein